MTIGFLVQKCCNFNQNVHKLLIKSVQNSRKYERAPLSWFSAENCNQGRFTEAYDSTKSSIPTDYTVIYNYL